METPVPENNTITIKLEDGKVTLNFEHNIRLDDFMAVMFTLQLQAMQQSTPPKDNKDYAGVRDLIYDNYNAGASSVLSYYAPDKELRPDLTQEALKDIMKAEDKYMEKKIKKNAPKTKGKVKNFPDVKHEQDI